jgi:hypothetical protein
MDPQMPSECHPAGKMVPCCLIDAPLIHRFRKISGNVKSITSSGANAFYVAIGRREF